MQKSPFTLKNSHYIVLFHCRNAEHQHITAHGTQSHELHRLYFMRRQARTHFRNSTTEEKSRSDCAQLTEMHRIL